MAQLELEDMQGFIARGYGNLPKACYLVLKIENAAAAREWLGTFTESVTLANRKPSDTSIHIAFTAAGLKIIGLDTETLSTFSREFWEGMHNDHRARHILGDRDDSAPENWGWGGPNTHVLLLLFASENQALESLYQQVNAGYRGLNELKRLDTHPFDSVREHFGFGDGIAQPFVDGLSRKGPPENTIPPGEIILGYPNAYGKYPNSPKVAPKHDSKGLLQRILKEDGEEAGDLGRNGSYLVFRQLSQDVQAFWRFVDEATQLNGRSDHVSRTRMAAKMVGRWPSGAPLTLCPIRDDKKYAARNDFGYKVQDAHGLFCPVGAHIRRTNPRDTLDDSAEASIKIANRHRILRRGRPYGAPISRTADVDEILKADKTHEEVGLHFICLNADIGRQFEFIQSTWINNPKFGGLYNDADPIMGRQDPLQGTFTIPGAPVRRRVTGMQQFVEMRGGDYFFLPGLRALQYLANL